MTSSPSADEKVPKYKEVSMRLIRPTQPEINVPLIMEYLSNWQTAYEMGDVVVYDEGLAQYLLCDRDSHHKFYAALILAKPSLRCRLVPADDEPPIDILEEKCQNRLALIGGTGSTDEEEALKKLTDKLGKKNYKFVVP